MAIKRSSKRNECDSPERPYHCVLCLRSFARRSYVKDPHFQTCAARLGNPDNLPWDSHSSCWIRNAMGPSTGVVPASLPSQIAEGLLQRHLEKDHHNDDDANDDKDEEGEEEDDADDRDMDRESGDAMIDFRALEAITERRDEEAVEEGGGRAPIVAHEKQLDHSGEEDMMGQDDTEDDSPKTLDWNQVNSLKTPEEEPLLDKEKPFPFGTILPRFNISGPLLRTMTMNQIVNVPMMASRMFAGRGDNEALKMWKMWKRLLPSGSHSNIVAPQHGMGQRERQQAVIWMAQDAFKAVLGRVKGLRDQLQMVVVWRDISQGLDDTEGVIKIHDLLVEAIGQEGPLLLGRFGGVDLWV